MHYLKNIEITGQFKKAFNLMEKTNKHVFVTGKAGTGKSTLLEYFRSRSKKKIVVLAPTGVAALNVRGQTIHSFFRFKPDVTIEKIKKRKVRDTSIFKKLDSIVIDEISMVRADLLDCIDYALRKYRNSYSKPFGGVQMIFIGDLYQLPPVVTRSEKNLFNGYYKGAYFFNANVFQEFQMEVVELEKIYRQKDEKFISILNSIRNNTVSDKEIEILNRCVGRKFSKDKKIPVITLTTINKKAKEINDYHLLQLKSKIHIYKARIKGEFEKQSYPADEVLRIAKGAQVMLLNNDSSGRWINGTLGEVIEIENKKDKPDTIIVRLEEGNIVEVIPYEWELFHFVYNEAIDAIETKTVGKFIQYPLKLAWAVTIHKSQGKTFQRVVIDFSRGTFAPGQAYVALSRCVSLDGISLTRPFKKGYVFTDPEIVNFLTRYQYNLSERDIPMDEKILRIQKAIREKKDVEILYLKPNGDKTRRIIKPYDVGEMMYADKPFIGIKAYCDLRKAERIFRLDRILEIENVG
ncbi:MAG: AAA family ATPase [Candidatus Omnitrophota bacterium]|nr:MAG: AAA family ATPase [Candidatus Omnitrophota bacterium]